MEADVPEWPLPGGAYLRQLENAHAVDIGSRATSEDEAVDRAVTILRNSGALGMSGKRAAHLAVLVLMAWQSRAVFGTPPTNEVVRLWEVT